MNKKVGEAKIPALDRGLDLLEWMAALTEPVSLTQIAQGLQLSVSEIQRPVACLLRRGYLRRSDAGAYRLSGRIAGLAGAHPPHERLRQSALGVMTEFARQYRESIHLCVPDWDAAIVLMDVPGGGLVRLSLQEGARLESMKSVSGRILTAFGALTSVGLKKSARAALKKIYNARFDSAASSKVVGITDTGVPVFDSAGEIVAALTVSVLQMMDDGKKKKNLLAALRDCAARISEGL